MILKNQGGFTRHTGVLLSLIILLILLVWNWDTCFAAGTTPIYERIVNWMMGTSSTPSTTMKEGFADTDVLTAGIDNTKLEVKIRPEDRALDVQFTGIQTSTLTSGSNIKGYLLVLAKYDKDMKQVGTLNVKLSDEGGSSLKEKLNSFAEKYKGVLSSAQVTSITSLDETNSYFEVATVFSDAVIKSNNQITDIFFALMDLLYTHKRNNKTTLYDIYNELRTAIGSTELLPSAITKSAIPPNTTAGVDYLSFNEVNKVIYTDEMAKSDAEQLKRAITDYPDLRNKLALLTYPYFMTKLNDLFNRIVELYMSSPVSSSTNKICETDNTCKYTFTELDPVDPQGEPYNYKLGVGVIIVDSNGADKVSKIDAYTYGGPKRLEFFKLTNTLEEQVKLIRRLDMVDRNKLAAAATPAPTQPVPGEKPTVGGDMDAYMKMLRPYLGDFPNEFQMSQAQMDDVSLSKYLQESLALGQVNVNLGISDLAAAPTATVATGASPVNFN